MEFFAISNGIPVHINDTKVGDKVILLLHGYLETSYIFSDFIELIEEFYRVIAIDLPGHGLSGSNKEINSMEFSATVATNVLNLCKVPEGTEVYVAGHSMGGYVAQSCLRYFPERYAGLILLNSTPFADSPDKASSREREIGLINSLKLQTLANVSIPTMYAKSNLRRLDDKILETIEICETHDPQGIVACIKGMMERPDNTELLKSIPKLLIIFGDSDTYITKEIVAKIEENAPNACSILIEESGHNSFIEQPEKTLAAIKEFIG